MNATMIEKVLLRGSSSNDWQHVDPGSFRTDGEPLFEEAAASWNSGGYVVVARVSDILALRLKYDNAAGGPRPRGSRGF